ncbi:MAG: sulfurtransferase [Candidatus Tectomicrobia bacterium]|nr:sulfurtransferase [Candidatus Tectomicrobia bacterium]
MAPQLSPGMVHQKIEASSERFTLLDVREPEELAISSLRGAKHIPMNSIPERLDELDPRHEIVVFCHHGMRSQMVADFLEQNGFSNVKNMAGGIDAWSQHVDPRVPRY